MNTAGSAVAAKPRRWLNRTVAGAGFTSALGDFCYETTTVILPGFLAVLGIPAAALGFIEGAADAVAKLHQDCHCAKRRTRAIPFLDSPGIHAERAVVHILSGRVRDA
jgi:hypothetical protein